MEWCDPSAVVTAAVSGAVSARPDWLGSLHQTDCLVNSAGSPAAWRPPPGQGRRTEVATAKRRSAHAGVCLSRLRRMRTPGCVDMCVSIKRWQATRFLHVNPTAETVCYQSPHLLLEKTVWQLWRVWMRQASLKDALKKHTYGQLHVWGKRGWGWGWGGALVIIMWLCLHVWVRARGSTRQLLKQQEGLLIPADRWFCSGPDPIDLSLPSFSTLQHRLPGWGSTSLSWWICRQRHHAQSHCSEHRGDDGRRWSKGWVSARNKKKNA